MSSVSWVRSSHAARKVGAVAMASSFSACTSASKMLDFSSLFGTPSLPTSTVALRVNTPGDDESDRSSFSIASARGTPSTSMPSMAPSTTA